MTYSPCLICICRYRCQLANDNTTECPVFAHPPEEPPTHIQNELPWDALEGTDRGGGT